MVAGLPQRRLQAEGQDRILSRQFRGISDSLGGGKLYMATQAWTGRVLLGRVYFVLTRYKKGGNGAGSPAPFCRTLSRRYWAASRRKRISRSD